MNIHQVNVTYVVAHDRLLLRINSLAGEEFRAWLTRRLALKLLPHFSRTAREQVQQHLSPPAAGASLTLQRQQLLENFQKEAEVYEGDFETPYQDQATQLPMGEQPLLVTEVTFTPLADAKVQVHLIERLPKQQRDLQLIMDPALSQALLKLLHQGLKASGWLEPVPALSEAAPIPARGEPDLLDSADSLARAKPRYLN